MKTRTTAVVAILGIGLLATGCATKDDQPPAKLGTSTSPSPSVAPSPTGPPEPTFNLPADVKVTIEPAGSTDDGAAEVLKANEHLIFGLLEAQAGKGGAEKGYRAYVQDNAALRHFKDLDAYKKRGYTITGSYVYFNRKVTFSKLTTATVTFCEDQRFAYSKVEKTGLVKKTKPSPSDFKSYRSIMSKGPDGAWRESEFLWKKGAPECQRS
jgi:hypothetical protein